MKDPELIVHTANPLNAEPPLDRLRQNFITPPALFYVRNHGETPPIDPAQYRLSVGGMVARALELTLDRMLNDFPRRTVMATLQCAGNRREQLIEVAPIPGEVPWRAGAIGNAFWSGVALKEILNAAGVRHGAQYVAFMGGDEVMRGGENVGFGGSIPLDKALSDETLLAYEMNGQPLAPEHGFPLRLIAPGYIGARSCKWLARIELQAAPSTNYFQARAYRLFPPQVTADIVDWSAGLPLGEFAVSAVICAPADGATISGPIHLQGYAVSGGGRSIARVDVSSDGGDSWTIAPLTGSETREGGAQWAWTFWDTQLSLPPGEHLLIARAVDSAANSQPDDPRAIWNFKGYMNNAWHRVRMRVTT